MNYENLNLCNIVTNDATVHTSTVIYLLTCVSLFGDNKNKKYKNLSGFLYCKQLVIILIL